jgi:hypothetical protein
MGCMRSSHSWGPHGKKSPAEPVRKIRHDVCSKGTNKAEKWCRVGRAGPRRALEGCKA